MFEKKEVSENIEKAGNEISSTYSIIAWLARRVEIECKRALEAGRGQELRALIEQEKRMFPDEMSEIYGAYYRLRSAGLRLIRCETIGKTTSLEVETTDTIKKLRVNHSAATTLIDTVINPSKKEYDSPTMLLTKVEREIKKLNSK